MFAASESRGVRDELRAKSEERRAESEERRAKSGGQGAGGEGQRVLHPEGVGIAFTPVGVAVPSPTRERGDLPDLMNPNTPEGSALNALRRGRH